MIEISDGVYIGEDELVFKASRSGGPGGQNVNKVSTRIVLLFDVANCAGLSETQKQQIWTRLATRIGKSGLIRVTSQRFRSQKANRQAAVERLCELLKAALETEPVRHRTKAPRHAHERRLERKKRRSLLKQQRAGRGWAEGLAT
jgi:ribosome-associated protein